MTTPTTDTGALTTKQPKPTSFVDWFHVNSRWVAGAGIVVAIAAVAAWYVPHQRALASQNADRMLLSAKQSLSSGNAQLAESDLRKVADRYAGTPSGIEAGMLIGQIRLEKGDAPGAVTYLRELVGKVGTGTGAAAARGLLADALMQSNKPAEAAAEYERAAEATKMPNEHAVLLSKAGYAWMNASRGADARRVFEALASQQESPALATEARVRLGELAAAARS